MSAGNYLEYESWTFPQDLIKNGNLYRSRDLLSASLEIDTLNVTVECNDPAIVKFQRNAKLTRYFNGDQDGTFYVQSIKRVGPKLYTINATSKIGLLQNGRHMGGIYTGETVEEVVSDICGTLPVSVKSNIKDIKLYGWLPIATPRANLSQVLFAVGATVKEDMLGTLRVEGLWDGMASTVPADRIYNDATVEYGSEVSSVSVTEHQYVEGGELTTLFEGTASYGDTITFSGPHYGLTATGFTILESGANYAKISAGSGTLQGRPYVHNTRQITKTVNAEADENIKTVSDATLVSLVNSNAVAERLVSYYKCTEVIDAPTIYGAEQTGDRLSVYHPFDHGFSAACLESEDITLSGVLRAQEKSLVGFVPIDTNTNLVNHVEVLTGSGTWIPPEGVKEFRAVLIQGGSAGMSGSPGGSSGRIESKSENGTNMYNKTIQTKPSSGAGLGGNGGLGGAPGKILEIPGISANGTFSYSCGEGGKSPGESGSETTFGEYSSASGTIQQNGFVDIINNTVYALAGKNGESGGAGGAAGFPGFAAPNYGAEGGPPTEAKRFPAYATGLGPFGGDTASLVGTSTGGGGGGGGGNSDGDVGSTGWWWVDETGSANIYQEIRQPSGQYVVYASFTPPIGGFGGNGASGRNGENYGSGGNGGGGGGGGGENPSVSAEFNTTFSGPVILSIQSRIGASGGGGGRGGNGADGCVLIYYSAEERMGMPRQLKDRTGKMVLDRYGRRIIM